MKNILAFLCSLSLLYGESPIRGFPSDLAAAEHAREAQANAIPKAENIRTYMERISAEPHHAGSPASKANAEYALGLMRGWGLDAHIEEFESLLPYPTTRMVEMTAPTKFHLHLKEPAISQDKDSSDKNQLPTYNAYSASGDVTAPLVYVNYGVPEDYAELAKLGINVKNKIVIARYGKSWRGTKPKVAAEQGALGCIIYSDPHEDGYFQADVYPKGPMRPGHGVQRGSVLDMPLYPGDPLSPGWASEKGSRRLTREQAKTIMKIPVLPISYDDARPLLEHLEGPVAPDLWRGALPFTYHIGPGPATVHMKLDFDWSTKPLYNVVAVIPGSLYPDQWILYGNHHDAWVNGASDPTSGTAVVLETARTLSELLKKGWRPQRTIVLTIWDGEEFGLIGSTEWVEKHLEELDRKAAVYINSDMNTAGTIGAGGSHTLEKFVNEVLGDLKDPVSGKNLLESAKAVRAGRERSNELHLSPLGAGSDYVAFIDHAGIASLNFGFSKPNTSGVYHSIYDSFTWYSRFADPNFAYGQALTEVMNTTLLRLSDAPVLPFEFGAFTCTVGLYLDDIRKQAGANASRIPFDDLASATKKVADIATNYENELNRLIKLPKERLGPLNELIYRTERSLIREQGLPGREWYRHQIYAPGLLTGYSAKTLPGVREAVEAGRWAEAAAQARAVVDVLDAMGAQLQKAVEYGN